MFLKETFITITAALLAPKSAISTTFGKSDRRNQKSSFHLSTSSSILTDTQNAISRRLSSVSVSEFCSNTTNIEQYTTEKILSSSYQWFLTPELIISGTKNEFICQCERVMDYQFWLKCTLMYMFTNGDLFTYGTEMQFENNIESDQYRPISTTWYEFANNNPTDTFIGETISLMPDDSQVIQSCEGYDSTCAVADVVCSVCPGGQTTSYDYNCYQQPCEGGVPPTFLFDYHLHEPLLLSPDDATVTCVTNGVAVGDFCENLHDIESKFDEELAALFSGSAILSDYGFECECGEMNVTDQTLLVSCSSNYTLENTDNMDTVSSEILEEAFFVKDGAYLTIASVARCDLDYCESFNLAIGQQGLSSCDMNGCLSRHCELCPNGISIVSNCDPADTTCDSEIARSSWLHFRDTKVALEICIPSTTGSGEDSTPPDSDQQTDTTTNGDNDQQTGTATNDGTGFNVENNSGAEDGSSGETLKAQTISVTAIILTVVSFMVV